MPQKITKSAINSTNSVALPTTETVHFHRVIIPSKGRAEARRATWHLLLAGGIPFTVVVEPQDAAAYETALQALADEVPVAVGLHPVFDPAGDHVSFPDSDSDNDDARPAVAAHPNRKANAARSRGRQKRSSRAVAATDLQNSTASSRYDVAVLPLNDQGVSFARNHILSEVAPARGWFWVMDDDITKFNRAAGGKSREMPAAEVMQIASHRIAACAQHSDIGLFSLEYQQFSFMYGDDDICMNSYANIAVCMNRARMPPGIRYRLRVREDYDFVLQMIQGGYRTVRLRNLSFVVPVMGTKAGGMTPYYDAQKRDIRLQNRLFLEAWGAVADEVEKGSGPSKRFDIRVKWQSLADPERARELLDPTHFTGFSVDPLATSLTNGRGAVPGAARTAAARSTSSAGRPNAAAAAAPATVAPRRPTTSRLVDSMTSDQPAAAASDGAPRARRSHRKRSPDAAVRLEPAVERPQPSPPVPKGWRGFREVKCRHVDPTVLAQFGLRVVERPTQGSDVVTIPYDVSQPVLSPGVVIECQASSGTVTVAPRRRGEPIHNVSHVFHVPADVNKVIADLERFYV